MSTENKNQLQNLNNDDNNENQELFSLNKLENKPSKKSPPKRDRSTNFITAPLGAPLDSTQNTGRPQRVALADQNRVAFPEREGFHRHIVRDTDPARIAAFKKAGYIPVEGDFSVSERSKDPSIMGSQRRIHLGKNDYGIMMEQRLDWYEEDQRRKVEVNNERLKDITKPRESQYGRIRIERK